MVTCLIPLISSCLVVLLLCNRLFMKPCPNFASIAKFLATQLTTALRPLKPGSRAPRELRTLSDVEVLMIVWSLLWKILWGMEKEKVCFRSSIWTQCKPRIIRERRKSNKNHRSHSRSLSGADDARKRIGTQKGKEIFVGYIVIST